MEMRTFLRANWDRVLAVVLVVVGVVMLILGWFGVSGTGLVAEQNPYLISAGLGGIAVLLIGCTIWLSSDLQDEWRRLDAIEERLLQMSGARRDTEDPTVELAVSAPLTNGAAPTVPAPAASRRSQASVPRARRVAGDGDGVEQTGSTRGRRRQVSAEKSS